MMRSGRWVLLALLPLVSVLTLAPAAMAQDEAQLRTDPPDTYLQVDGPLSFSGRAELPLSIFPYGEYRLQGKGSGLAASRLQFVVDGRGLTSRPWSGPQALLKPPGLDHLSRDEGRGWFHFGIGSFGGVFWGLGFQAVGDAEDKIQLASDAVSQAADADALAQAQIGFAEARDKKVDEERLRNLWATYFIGSWLGAGLEAWLLTPEASLTTNADGVRVRLPRATGWGAAGRSILVAGAGQRYLGHNTRANVFSTLVAASAASAILAQDYYLRGRRAKSVAERQLSLATTAEVESQRQAALDNATSELDSRSTLRWVAVGAIAYFYAWNVVDAYRLGHQAESERPGPTISLAPMPASGMALTMSWGFH